MGYTKDTLKGFSWGVGVDISSKGISFAKNIILSRFIFGPAEFGIFGVGFLILGFLELITETGINVYLVQEKDGVKEYLDTAWVVSIARGILISIIIAILSYPIALFFKIPDYRNFILAISIIPLVRGFLNPGIVSLQKNLKFRKDSLFRFTVYVIEDIATLIFAFATHSVFSFVLGVLIGVIVEVILTFVLVTERPKFSFNKEKLNKIIHRGKWLTAAYIFDYLFEHGDDFAVGKLLNVASLGIYQLSYTISIVPQKTIAERLGRVTFPVFTKIVEDKNRVKRAFLRTVLVTLILVGAFGVVLYFVADPVVRLVLGEKWLPAIPVLRVLAFFGVIRAMTNLAYPLFLAYKKQEYISATTLVGIVVLGILIVPLTLKLGLIGAGVAAIIGSLASLPVAAYFVIKILK